MTDRRTVLTMLGLAPVGSVGAETFLNPSEHSVQAGNDTDSAVIAQALHKLAVQIENKTAYVAKLSVHTDVAPCEVVKHTISIDFFYSPEAVPTS